MVEAPVRRVDMPRQIVVAPPARTAGLCRDLLCFFLQQQNGGRKVCGVSALWQCSGGAGSSSSARSLEAFGGGVSWILQRAQESNKEAPTVSFCWVVKDSVAVTEDVWTGCSSSQTAESKVELFIKDNQRRVSSLNRACAGRGVECRPSVGVGCVHWG